METNYFECPYCKKHTRHITVTMTEISSVEEKTEFGKVIGGIFGTMCDYTGLTKCIQTVVGKEWKCAECGTYTFRDHSGRVKEEFRP